MVKKQYKKIQKQESFLHLQDNMYIYNFNGTLVVSPDPIEQTVYHPFLNG